MGWAEWALIVIGIVAAAITGIAWMAFKDDRDKRQRVAWAELSAAEREHELALADREVEMWRESLAVKPTTFAEHLGGRRAPKLVGRSQVLRPPGALPMLTELDTFDTSQSTPLEGRKLPDPGVPPHDVASSRPGEDLPVKQCSRYEQHEGHRWVAEPSETSTGGAAWCDGLNADGTAPYDPGRPGWDADIAREQV